MIGHFYALASGSPAHTDAKLLNRRIFADPATVAAILDDPEVYRKNFALLEGFGRSRFNTNGSVWRERRAITQPAYTAAAHDDAYARIYRIIAQELSSVTTPTPAAVGRAFNRATLRVFLGAFGAMGDPAPLVDFFDDLRGTLVDLQYLSWRPAEPHLVEACLAAARESIRQFSRIFLDDVGLRPVFGRFAAHFGSYESEEAAEELLMNMFAGSESVTAGLCWLVDRLGVNQAVAARIRDEFTSAGSSQPYADCFIKETLRFFPSIPFVTREVTQDTTIGDRALRAGEHIFISVVGVHHNPDYWDQPAEFQSARLAFLNDSYDRTAFIPFLAGPRICGGSRLARIELSGGLRALVEQFVVHNDTGEIAFDYAIALHPRFAQTVSIERRPQ